MACLDTDFLVAYLRNDPKARSKLEELESTDEPVHTTIINAFELYKGAFKARDTRNELARVDKLLDAFFILMLDRNAAQSAGALHDKSNPIGESDLLIASIALSNNQTLITKNKKHFEKVPGLQVESW
ncbi:MAG: type II toxin-antitoxin system VapC family toxin [Nitrososphaera sp.]|uniref:type II toxin-antitoxin system VapC family toxin n=1 Tax=Nitrososphaera sp. TaxID=1971748 RepID=UPI00178EB7CA|nr:type II toxin-antitoxin system VapC family toxin [Nitrososphaera sp.]NWG37511.1 type II toxin-antitoxin system VapC family toxin [Nitrososphaera sp.]